MELEKGKLYQVRHWSKGWIIAEYLAKWQAHDTQAMSLSADLRHFGKARKVHVPESHSWRTITGTETFRIYTKDLQVRPVSEETLAEVARLKAEIERLRQEQAAVTKELRELCS